MSNFIKDCTGVVLAGGENTRMPVLKAFIKVEGRPVISRTLSVLKQLFTNTLIVTNQPEHYAHLVTPLIGDVYDIRGPMTGIFTSLLNSRAKWIFVSACDMPFLNRDLIMYMSSMRDRYDAVVPGSPPEPLYAFYSKRLLPSMERALLSGKKGMKDFLRNKKVKYISMEELEKFDSKSRAFINLNTPEDVRYYMNSELM